MIIGVGENPMLSLYLCSLTDSSLISIATNVANKLKSSIFSMAKSWWGAPKEDEVELPKPHLTPPTKLAQSTYLSDDLRFLSLIDHYLILIIKRKGYLINFSCFLLQ